VVTCAERDAIGCGTQPTDIIYQDPEIHFIGFTISPELLFFSVLERGQSLYIEREWQGATGALVQRVESSRGFYTILTPYAYKVLIQSVSG
jgi:hypothetical protein